MRSEIAAGGSGAVSFSQLHGLALGVLLRLAGQMTVYASGCTPTRTAITLGLLTTIRQGACSSIGRDPVVESQRTGPLSPIVGRTPTNSSWRTCAASLVRGEASLLANTVMPTATAPRYLQFSQTICDLIFPQPASPCKMRKRTAQVSRCSDFSASVKSDPFGESEPQNCTTSGCLLKGESLLTRSSLASLSRLDLGVNAFKTFTSSCTRSDKMPTFSLNAFSFFWASPASPSAFPANSLAFSALVCAATDLFSASLESVSALAAFWEASFALASRELICWPDRKSFRCPYMYPEISATIASPKQKRPILSRIFSLSLLSSAKWANMSNNASKPKKIMAASSSSLCADLTESREPQSGIQIAKCIAITFLPLAVFAARLLRYKRKWKTTRIRSQFTSFTTISAASTRGYALPLQWKRV